MLKDMQSTLNKKRDSHLCRTLPNSHNVRVYTLILFSISLSKSHQCATGSGLPLINDRASKIYEIQKIS